MDDANKSLRRNSMLGVLFIGVLSVMLIPVPPLVLDALLCINITLALLIVMAVLNTDRPTELSTFPTILLFTALFRLSLNVASTRLILLEGDAGNVIRTFGDFVVGGDPVVGVIVFLILIVIQFIVITKGQNRISEVAARFTLDAMPGKQMSIDADLSAGIISNEEAKERRRALSAEAEFHGSMDGAGKFVRGDAVAGIIITGINIAGGLVIAMVYNNMAFSDALEKYTILTVGDGLVSQIPGLIISTSAAILVTKSGSDSGLGAEMGQQMFHKAPALRAVAVIAALVGLLPGMPTLIFLAAGTALWVAGRRADERQANAASAADAAKAAAAEGEASEESPQHAIEELLTVDRLGIEIGYRLISLVEAGRHGGLLDHIRAVRKQFASSLGIVVPPIRVKDNIAIDPNCYRILLGGQEIAKGSLRAGNYLAMDPSGLAGPIDGIDTTEPAFGLPAKWIAEAQKERAEAEGWTVIDAPSVLITHLTEILKTIASELLSRDDVKLLVENLKKAAPAVVEELIPGQLSLGQVQTVLANLLKEQVPIRNLQSILEALADSSAESKDPRQMTERVRSRIARTILEPHLDHDGTLHAAIIDPDLERALSDAVGGGDGMGNLPPGFLARFVDETATALSTLSQEGRNPVLVTRAALRPFLAEAIAGVIPGAAVLSYQETSPARKVETTAKVAVPA